LADRAISASRQSLIPRLTEACRWLVGLEPSDFSERFFRAKKISAAERTVRRNRELRGEILVRP
jgi:hypothetical protein